MARRLRHHQFLRLARQPALCLRAERGTLWVTVDGETEDIELNAGESRRFDAGAVVTVGTLGGDAVLTATRLAAAPRWLQRLRDWLVLPSANLNTSL
jgi:hypothetical protein